MTPGHRYIIAQILGAYIACALIYAQYKVLIIESEGALRLVGKYDEVQFTPSGLAGIFGLYALPGQTMGRTFLNEFVTVSHQNAVQTQVCPDRHYQDVFLALVIWASIDPTNILVPPVMSPFIVAAA